jgi:hypothetical protein
MGRKDPSFGDLPSIRTELEREYDSGAAPDNFKRYWKIVGGASLKPEFAEIVAAIANAKKA